MGITSFILLLLIGLPLLEIAVFVEVGSRIGAGATVALVVLMAIGGILAMRGQGLVTLRRAQASLEKGVPPVAEVLDGACLLLAGGLLLFPGFVTDAVGLLLFIPVVRREIGRWIRRHLRAGATVRFYTGPRQSRSEGSGQGPVIDGQYEDLTDNDPAEAAKLPPRNDPGR